MKKSVYKVESNLRARRRTRRVRIAVAAGLGVLVLVGAVIASFWLPAIRVNTIVVTGATVAPQVQVEAAVRHMLDGTYGFVVPRDNIFFYPKQQVIDQLPLQFPSILHTSVSVQNFHTVAVSVTERKPSALWCGGAVASSSGCMVLDQDGVVYAPAADFSGDDVYMRYVGPVVGTTTLHFLTPESFHTLSALVDAFSKKTGPVDHVSIENGTDVRVSFANGFAVLCSLEDDTADILARYDLVIAADPFTKHPISDFLYLDLRFGNKLYYKLKTQ